jgi:hypothetical protein
VVIFVFNDLRWEMISCVIDNGGIVDHQFWNFLFITNVKKTSHSTNSK